MTPAGSEAHATRLPRPPAAGADAPGTRLARIAAVALLGVVGFNVALDLTRIAIFVPGAALGWAIAATAAYAPLHLWHLSYGLRGERAPHALATFALMVAIHAAAMAVVGLPWSYSLTSVAVSALVILRPAWALVVLVACAATPALVPHDAADLRVALGSNVWYLVFTVVFRTVLPYSLVWLVASSNRLATSRAQLAEQAVARERDRIEAEVRDRLDRDVRALVAAGHEAQAALGTGDATAGGGPAATTANGALGRALALSRDTLSTMRRVVADARQPSPDDAAPLADAARAARVPVLRSLGALGPVPVAVAVHLMMFSFAIMAGTNVLGPRVQSGVWLVVVLWVLAVALQTLLSAAVIRGRVPRWSAFAWLGLVAVAVVANLAVEPQFEIFVWFPVASVLMASFGRRRPAAFAVTAALVLWNVVYESTTYGETTAMTLWLVGYELYSFVFMPAALYASTRLSGIVGELRGAREQLADHAAWHERRRVSGDLHDVLGQTLTAISLKGDLAKRLLAAGDAPGARAEVADLVTLADGQLAELTEIARGRRHMTFAAELRTASDLLAAADVAVEAHVAAGDLDPAVSTLLGRAVREGATNVLRHSLARACSIEVERVGDRIRLEIANDRVERHAAETGTGSGLAGLRERAHGLGGDVLAERLPGGRHRLVVEAPAHPQGTAAGADVGVLAPGG